jgi:hypothetical protein
MPKHAIQMMSAAAANVIMVFVRQLFESRQVQVQATPVHPLKVTVQVVPHAVARTVYLIQRFVDDVSVSRHKHLAFQIGNVVLVVVDKKPMYVLKSTEDKKQTYITIIYIYIYIYIYMYV